MNQAHHFKFSHYETQWIDGQPTQPYPVTVAVLVCTRCGHYSKQVKVRDDKTCIEVGWPALKGELEW